MHHYAAPAPPLLVAVVGLLAAMALSGCDVTGTITVRADNLVDLNLRAVIASDQSCDWQLGSNVRTGERRMWRGGDERLCLIQGTVPAEALRIWHINVTHTGEYLDVVADPVGPGFPSSAINGAPAGVRDLAIVVEFPGQITESNGIIEGSTVRFTDVSELGRPGGLRAVALDHPGPPFGVVIPIVAFGLGLAAMAVLWAATTRPAGPVPFVPTLARNRAPVPNRLVGHAPGSMLPDDLRAGLAPAAGESGWERPRAAPPQDVAPRAQAPPEHTKWAPPGPD